MSQTESQEELNEIINKLSDEEADFFLNLFHKKDLLVLLNMEAQWISSHHWVDDCDKEDCESSYSGDTDFDRKRRLDKMLL